MTTLHGDWTGLLSFLSAVLLSTFILLLPSSSVSLSNFYLAVPMRGCLGKHSCMSSPFPRAILNGTCSLRALILFCVDVPAIKAKLNKLNKSIGALREQVPFSMAIENGELMHECFPKHLRMGTARLK